MGIQNDHQYTITQTKLRELEQALADLAVNPSNLSDRLLQAEKQGIQVLIDRLHSEMVEYDRLKPLASVEDLAIARKQSTLSGN
jgi:hypothetical protein